MTLHVVRYGTSQAPILRCLLCRKEFYDYEVRKYKAHAARCSADHAEQIEAARLVNQGFFDPAKLGTKDIEDWVAKHRTELLEKRKKL